jgi:hypothetical protein
MRELKSRFPGAGGSGLGETFDRSAFWLPYAGITRIRFKGFSCEFSVRDAHTPSQNCLYQSSATIAKTAAGGGFD